MKHIYVIGNGFDIDLGWRTSYKDFYETKLKGWSVHFGPNDDCLPKYLLDHAGENWYDLERTVYDYCLLKSKGNLNEDLMNRDYQDYVSIKGQLERFVKERSSELVNERSKAYEILKSYVERSSHTDLPNDMRPELISFNYTPLDKVAKQINPKVDFKYIPIHGTIDKNSCIFGFHDDIQIKGLYRDMQKSMDDNYDPGRIMPLLMDAKSITFFGLSMGYIDAVYFKEVLKAASQPGDFKNRKTMDIEFVTKDKGSKKDIKKNLQDIGIDFQALSTNNKVTFTLTSEKNNIKDMDWKEKAIKILKDSLYPIPSELNELDWKSGLSDKTERLAQHISAFANMKGGGILVYGVHNDGTCFDLTKEEIDKTVQTLGNIAHNNLVYSIPIEHSVMMFEGHSLLFVYIPEQEDKPVHLRGKDIYASYYRSAGQTVKMSRNQVKALIAASQGITFEQQVAKEGLTKDEVLRLLNYKALYRILDKNIPQSTDAIIERLTDYHLCKQMGEGWCITNLGAILFANELKDFPNMEGNEVIVRKYVGTNNRQQEFEQHGAYGYAVGFEGLIDFIMHNSSSEQIDVTREDVPTYPMVAIREFVANALVHQDFGITGMPVTIEIFSNRLSITNAGAPLNDINRLIDLPPQSRNEQLAQMMFTLGICERRGSGIDRAIAAIEKMYLPPVKFTKSEQHTRVFLYPQKSLKEMTKQEKISACYQHACLMYEDGEKINNQSVRERFELTKNDTSIASRIIADTLEAGLIKPADIETSSKKYMTYIPYYG